MAVSDEELIEKIQKTIEQTGRHPFLFLGSGFSMRYLETPTFEELLRYFTSKISDDKYKFASYGTEDTRLPEIAQELEKDFNKEFFSNENFLRPVKKHNADLINDRVSPFKIVLARFFKSFKEEKLNQLQDPLKNEINLLKQMSIRSVSGVITTNYDNLAEYLFKGFKKYIGQDELFFAGIQEISEIYKIHGCCSDPRSILITQRDYNKFNEKGKYLAAKLMTIFLEYPIIFIGYSISDENIRNIIENITECLTPEQLNKLSGRLFFIKRLKGNEQQSVTTYSYSGLNMTQIVTNDFSLLYQAILNVRAKFNPRTLRRLKKEIYDIVVLNKPSESIKVVGLADIDDPYVIDDVVIGVGVEYYGREPTAVDIYKDILIDDARLDAKKVLEDYMPKLITQSTKMPVFKYIQEAEEGLNLDDKIQELVNSFEENGMSALHNKTDKNKFDKYSEKYKNKTIRDLENMETNEELLHPYKAYGFVYLLDITNINLDDFHRILLNTYNNNNAIIKDYVFKKAIRLYDYLKYGRS